MADIFKRIVKQSETKINHYLQLVKKSFLFYYSKLAINS